MRCARDLERTRARDEGLILNGVLDRTETVTEGVLGLLDRMGVRALDEKRHALGILDILNERVLLLAKCVLVDETCPAEDVGAEVIDRVLRDTAANELQPDGIA